MPVDWLWQSKIDIQCKLRSVGGKGANITLDQRIRRAYMCVRVCVYKRMCGWDGRVNPSIDGFSASKHIQPHNILYWDFYLATSCCPAGRPIDPSTHLALLAVLCIGVIFGGEDIQNWTRDNAEPQFIEREDARRDGRSSQQSEQGHTPSTISSTAITSLYLTGIRVEGLSGLCRHIAVGIVKPIGGRR